MRKKFLYSLLLGTSLLLTIGCSSTKKNTAQTRFYESFVTRFNVYHNGNEAYKQGVQEQDKSHKDNYMEVIPLLPVADASTQKIGAGNFDKAIEKSQKAIKLHSIKTKPERKPGRTLDEKGKQWYAKKEYNPFMHNAWMLMAKAQFQKGEFLEAASTFSYIARLYSDEPAIVAEARMRMAECYALLEWNYEADNLFLQTKRDSIPYQLQPEYEALYASYLLKQERFEEALPHLEKAVKRSGRTQKQKAREYYLLGQIYKLTGDKNRAFKSFGKAIRQNPPYELEFNARIQQTETVTGQTARKMVKTLKKMAHDVNNKDYLDQVYYAMGNIHLAQKDTVQALEYYEQGAKESTRNGVEKGILLLQMGDLYWTQADYVNAQRCYGEAIGLIDQENKRHKEISLRSAVLDELVEHTVTIDLQDSLQHLATLPEEELYKVIDQLIEETIRKEEEAAKAAEEEALMAKREEALGTAQSNLPTQKTPTVSSNDKSWYFYNTQLVSQGKKDFQQKWGRRKAEDHWRRNNKTVLADATFEAVNYNEEEGGAPADSLAADSTGIALPDSLSSDPHDRMFYLQQIPFTEDQLMESNALLSEALFSAGIIYKDKLEDFKLAEQTLKRLYTQFPDFEKLDEIYYNLYLMYARWKQPEQAEQYKQLLLTDFPYSDYSVTLSDPDFAENALYGKHREDSLYAATYTAYQEGDFTVVTDNATLSGEKYPLGTHRPKFLFLSAMSQLQLGDASTFLAQLKEIVSKYPKNEISELAGLIAQGLQEGRLLASGSLGSIWSRRLMGAQEGETVADSLRPAFNKERFTPFTFILAYEDSTVNNNQLLFEMARYNFTNFMVRNFDMNFIRQGGITLLQVKEFLNFDEARLYMRRLYADPEMATKLSGIKALLITEENLQLLFKYYSFDEYQTFFEQQFNTLPVVEAAGTTLDELPLDDSEE